MAQSAGDRLLELLAREWLSALHDAAARLTDRLATLGPDPAFDGTPFAGRVLARVDDLGGVPVLALVATLVGGTPSGPHVAVHGWRDAPAPDSPRGLALVVASGGPAVLAVTVVPGEPRAVVLRAGGLTGGTAAVVGLPSGATLQVSGTTSAELAAAVLGDGAPPTPAAAVGDRVEITLERAGPGPVWGLPGGPSVRLGAVSAQVTVAVTADGVARSADLALEGGEVLLAPGFLAALVPMDLTFPLDLDLRAAPGTGATLGGSPSLSARLPGPGAAPWLDVVVDVVDAADGPRAQVTLTTAVDVDLPAVPVHLRAEGLGLALALPLRPGPGFTPAPDAVRGAEPTGAEVAVSVPVVSGAGVLRRRGADLVGALAVEIPPMSASAFAALTPAADGRPLSLLVIMGATFPPPGVQIGFGFAVMGLGGVIGINRRIDRDALLRAVADGSAAGLLFPADPVGAGERALEVLPAVFPASRGSVVAGPMFRLGWGGQVVTLSVAVLVESGVDDRLTILGTIVVALPDPAAPIVLIRATFAGLIEPTVPSVTFLASLEGSHIVGAPLTGDIFLLTRGGPDPELVLSAGGFHPAFRVPAGVPVLRRLSLDLSPVPWIELRCEAYVAVTSTTLQLGARLELVAEVAGCGLRGWLAFDALLQLDPFRFVADVSGGLALRAFGRKLLGVQLALHLEGPAPYLARGRGSIDIFLFEVSLDFEVGWGRPAAPLTPAPDVGAALRAALADPAAWRSRGDPPRGVVLTDAAREALGAASVVDPYGSVTVQQTRVPLGVEIGRLDGRPVPTQRWDLVGARLRDGEPARTSPLRADFPPAHFLAPASDDEALATPAFLPLVSGATLTPEPATGAPLRPVDLSWEERVIVQDLPVPVRAGLGDVTGLDALSAVLVATSVDDGVWWPEPEVVVEVVPAPPAVAVSTWSMATADVRPEQTVLEMEQALGGFGDLVAVEAWEVAVR
ncbi:DUF6603 domain-containing protein [Cellulomonas carbonis]|uniref:DUF6603 domain-containing protein n=1 Tax=Cellulomonas carbonis T26 TaxID=947969 RepID=A0A0A0BSN0_9CELL|nr:DUF6603 domain-containing protein [Cellulomonas carbonis]KGM10662.1 hypothetical protein N868_14165 [Cellulomonas carbonis T26]GGB92155.1 hypothetical protein GCM10010972_01030 [Cellulomonas carbonis]